MFNWVNDPSAAPKLSTYGQHWSVRSDFCPHLLAKALLLTFSSRLIALEVYRYTTGGGIGIIGIIIL